MASALQAEGRAGAAGLSGMWWLGYLQQGCGEVRGTGQSRSQHGSKQLPLLDLLL